MLNDNLHNGGDNVMQNEDLHHGGNNVILFKCPELYHGMLRQNLTKMAYFSRFNIPVFQFYVNLMQAFINTIRSNIS